MTGDHADDALDMELEQEFQEQFKRAWPKPLKDERRPPCRALKRKKKHRKGTEKNG